MVAKEGEAHAEATPVAFQDRNLDEVGVLGSVQPLALGEFAVPEHFEEHGLGGEAREDQESRRAARFNGWLLLHEEGREGEGRARPGHHELLLGLAHLPEIVHRLVAQAVGAW